MQAGIANVRPGVGSRPSRSPSAFFELGTCVRRPAAKVGVFSRRSGGRPQARPGSLSRTSASNFAVLAAVSFMRPLPNDVSSAGVSAAAGVSR